MKQSQIEAAQILLQVAKGRKGQIKTSLGHWANATWGELLYWAHSGNEIRLYPLSFPSLPEGEEWHNPDNLTPEQVEVYDEWRLYTQFQKQKELGDEVWNNSKKRWEPALIEYCINPSYTYRTKRPLPEKKPKFEVGKKYKMRGGGWAEIKEINARHNPYPIWLGKDLGSRTEQGLQFSGGTNSFDLLPEEVTFKKVRIGAEEWKGKPVVWVKGLDFGKGVGQSGEYLVTVIGENGFQIENSHIPKGCILWNPDENIPANCYEYSFDRVTWHPFEKEEIE